jgi:hypothetical protein
MKSIVTSLILSLCATAAHAAIHDGKYVLLSETCAGQLIRPDSSSIKHELSISGQNITATATLPDGCEESFTGDTIGYSEPDILNWNFAAVTGGSCSDKCTAQDKSDLVCQPSFGNAHTYNLEYSVNDLGFTLYEKDVYCYGNKALRGERVTSYIRE